MSWKMHYRFVIYATNGALPDGQILAVGYDGGALATLGETSEITSLNTAVSQAMAFNRRFQASGMDCRAEVYGMPFDDGVGTPATPARALLPAEIAEQRFASLDTPDRGLLQRLSLANKPQASGGAALDDYPGEDVA